MTSAHNEAAEGRVGMGESYGARTPWSPAGAFAFALIALGLGVLAAIAAGTLYFQLVKQLSASPSAIASRYVTTANTMMAMIVMQATMIGLVWWGAGRFGGTPRRVLSLSAGLDLRMFLVGLAGMVLILGPYNLFIYAFSPDLFTQDLRPFADLARSQAAWLAAIVVVIGAPISEEMLFRGFLLPALSKSAWQFRGAAVVTTVAWTLMHTGYSVFGMVEVALVGLYFSWLMWRYQTLWLPLALHALYNGLQMLALIVLPIASSA